jgi:folate-binding protein YgfZ
MTHELASPNLLADYQALADGKGFWQLPDWTSVAIQGCDRTSFLNNFCSNDVSEIKPNETCEAFLTDVKGKVIAQPLIICRPHDLLLITVPHQAEPIIAHLDRYILREDVYLKDTTLRRSFIVATFDPSLTDLPQDILSIKCSWFSSTPTFLIEIPAEVPSARLIKQLSSKGRLCQTSAPEAVRIEAGLPRFGIDFDQSNFPQEIGRDQQAISFTKGCYLGQETVARIDAMGHVNQQIAGLQFDENHLPTAGTLLSCAGNTVGKLTSVAYSPELQAPIALGMIRRGHYEVGGKLDSPFGTCHVVALPMLA